METTKKTDQRPLSWGERVEKRKRKKHQRPVRRWGWLAARWRALKHVLGARAVVVVDGVQYRERSTVSLRRALSASGPGVKEYRVRFPSNTQREPMKIRATRKRIFDDLCPDPRVVMYRQIEALIRPGSRVLELGCGTGGGTRLLSEAVGPSGGVVAMNRDGESIRFARQRYGFGNIGFEVGWIETLKGELDGAFDVVCVVDPMRAAEDDPARSWVMGELWRVLGPAGILVVLCSSEESARASIGRVEAVGCVMMRTLDAQRCEGWVGAKGVMGVKGGEKPSSEVRKDPPDLSW